MRLSLRAAKDFLQRPEVKYILVLFLLTRLVLAVIGVSARMVLASAPGAENFQYSSNKVLAIWGVWDTGWYLNIAQRGYSVELGHGPMTQNQANYAFFPLYPAAIAVVNLATRNAYVAGLMVSNICLLLAAFVLYRLIRLDYGEEAARRAVKFLFLFPTAFILSGVFSESIFLLLLLLVFYFARCARWSLVGLCGFFLALSRPPGVLMVLPVACEYFRNLGWKWRQTDARLFYLLAFPLGAALFFWYVHVLTGNVLSYFTAQTIGWGHVFSDPVAVLVKGLLSKDIFQWLNSVLLVALIGALVIKARAIRSSYVLAAIVLVVFPLISGGTSLNSMMRYALPVFPFFLAFALLSDKPKWDEGLTLSLALLQGSLMVFWTTGFPLIV